MGLLLAAFEKAPRLHPFFLLFGQGLARWQLEDFTLLEVLIIVRCPLARNSSRNYFVLSSIMLLKVILPQCVAKILGLVEFAKSAIGTSDVSIPPSAVGMPQREMIRPYKVSL
jgi:hypothetical protein